MKKYILIADPSKVSRFVLEYYLSDKYNILMAESIVEARRMLSLAIPSLVLVAYELKDGFGNELCRYVNEHFKNVPVVIISSEDNDERRRIAIESGAIDYLVRTKIDDSIVSYVDELVELIEISNVRGSIACTIINHKDDEVIINNVLHSLGMQVFNYNIDDDLDIELLSKNPDIIIVDLDIGKNKGLELIKKIRKMGTMKKVPIIIITDSRESTVLRSLMLFGANDYTLKPLSPESIMLRVTANIRTKKLYDYLDRINNELYQMATTDPMTGLYNRRYILEQLNILNYNFERYGTMFSVILMDLDKFKNINDTYGHDCGDKVIIDFAHRVKSSVRKTDFVGRFGGEELIVVLQNIDEENLYKITKKILYSIRNSSVNYNNFVISYTTSIGAKYCNSYYPNIDEYIKKADNLLYLAKENGRNRAYIENSSGVVEVV
ncbi:MAG: diguanylate cyclase [Calditerrivibrio sp.]|uniref:GGDEF domain-containing response regulator n=1 Tax=Calditerrivibrio sp. TaxID=2792612 RepID=UPI003D12AA59